ncbi:MAG: DNA polymerase III subunit alpha, partial [Proteobacteria bacterium]
MNAPIRHLQSATSVSPKRPAQAGFVHLKVHSAYSLLEGALPIGKLAKLCQEFAFPAVALTDTNNLFGVLEFSDKLSAAGVQPIAGVSIAIDFEEGRQERTGTGPSSEAARRHDGMIALYAMSERGYANLMKLVSRAHLLSAEHEGPHIKFS